MTEILLLYLWPTQLELNDEKAPHVSKRISTLQWSPTVSETEIYLKIDQ